LRKFVLTGGPCTGKTTTLNALLEKGFHVIPETPRVIIEQQQSVGGDILPWKNVALFQIEVMRKQLDMESKIQQGATAFLDRGVADAIAYCNFYGISAPEDLLSAARRNRYDGVFMLDMLPVYETDSGRKEDAESARKIHDLIRKVYTGLDYDVIDVPVASVGERIELILSKTKP
jgi:predicted ATPase